MPRQNDITLLVSDVVELLLDRLVEAEVTSAGFREERDELHRRMGQGPQPEVSEVEVKLARACSELLQLREEREDLSAQLDGRGQALTELQQSLAAARGRELSDRTIKLLRDWESRAGLHFEALDALAEGVVLYLVGNIEALSQKIRHQTAIDTATCGTVQAVLEEYGLPYECLRDLTWSERMTRALDFLRKDRDERGKIIAGNHERIDYLSITLDRERVCPSSDLAARLRKVLEDAAIPVPGTMEELVSAVVDHLEAKDALGAFTASLEMKNKEIWDLRDTLTHRNAKISSLEEKNAGLELELADTRVRAEKIGNAALGHHDKQIQVLIAERDSMARGIQAYQESELSIDRQVDEIIMAGRGSIGDFTTLDNKLREVMRIVRGEPEGGTSENA